MSRRCSIRSARARRCSAELPVCALLRPFGRWRGDVLIGHSAWAAMRRVVSDSDRDSAYRSVRPVAGPEESSNQSAISSAIADGKSRLVWGTRQTSTTSSSVT